MKQKLLITTLAWTIGVGLLYADLGTDTLSTSLFRAYSELSSWRMYGVTHWAIGECMSDNSEVGGYNPADLPDLQELMAYNVSATNSEVRLYWERAYNIIYFCNKVINLAPEVSIDQTLKDRYIAEARFLRSLMYFELAIAFNKVPVLIDIFPRLFQGPPFYDYDPVSRIYNKEPDSLVVVFAQIKTDLTEAISDLPVRSDIIPGEEYRATQSAARALLAKVYMYESSYAHNYPGDPRFAGLNNEWANTLLYAEQVINDGDFEMTIGLYDTWWDTTYLYEQETPAYRYIFSVEGNNCGENVFSATNLTGDSYSPYGMNVLTQFTTCRGFKDDGGVSHGSSHGWGLNCPTDSLKKAFAIETGNPNDDPRFDVTFLEEEDSILLTYNSQTKWYAADPEMNSPTGMTCNKFECSPEQFYDNNNYFQGPLNIPVIRMADVYLMASEADFMIGMESEALTYLNRVRERARCAGYTPADKASITFDDIVLERQLELAMEGCRFFDLVRWGKAADVLNGRYLKTYNSTVTFEAGVDEFLLLPEGAICIDTTAPSIPMNLSAEAISTSQINLNWDPSVDSSVVIGYYIYRDGILIDSVPDTLYHDMGLSVNTEYEFRIAAYDILGYVSEQSQPVSETSLDIDEAINQPSSDLAGLEYLSQSSTLILRGEMSCIVVYNIIGSKIAEIDVKGRNSVSISELPQGIYIVSGLTSQGRRINLKLIK